MTITNATDQPLAGITPASEENSAYGAGLILALDRLFKVGPYYPPGHTACKRVTSDFQNVMKHFLGDESVLSFRVDKGEVFLQGRLLEADSSGAKDFQNLICTLGVDHLEIDSHASVEDLLTFVTRFLAFRNEIAGVKKFQQMAFEGLPRTVRISQRQFTTGIAIGVDPNQAADGTEDGGANDGSIEDPSGDSDGNQDQAPGLSEGTVVGEFEGEAERDSDDGITMTENLDHALNPNGHVVAAPPRLAENKRPVAENLDQLVDRLESAGQTDIRSRALESIELMIQNLGRGGKNNSDFSDFLGTVNESVSQRQERIVQKKPSEKPAEKGPKKPVYELSLPDLRSALADYAGPAMSEYHPPEQDNSEYLSIIVQLLTSKQPADVLRSMERKLARFLESKLQPSERTIVVAGVRNILSIAEEAVQFKSLPLMIRAFRASRFNSTVRFLGDICTGCSAEQGARFWPYLVNEILLGDDDGDRVQFLELCRKVGSLPEAQMREQAPLLRKLEALKKSSFSEDVIQPPLPELFPVFSVLMEASHPGQIAVKLVRGLKYEPPAGVGEIVLPLISDYRHGYREFLVDLLAAGQEDGPSAALLESSGKILATDLQSLDPKRRGEPWVPETILGLAELPVPGVESILKTIKGRRFLFLFPTWSKECRNAAAEALELRRIAELAAAAAEEARAEAAEIDAADFDSAAPEATE
jgi:hypothetical protein